MTVKFAILTPLNFTAVAPLNLEPLIKTVTPTDPLVGEKEVMAGGIGAVTVKVPVLVAVPTGVVTLILPVVAPCGTMVVI